MKLFSVFLYLGPGTKSNGAAVGLSEVFTLPTNNSVLERASCEIPQDTNKANEQGMVGFILDGYLTICGRKLVSSSKLSNKIICRRLLWLLLSSEKLSLVSHSLNVSSKRKCSFCYFSKWKCPGHGWRRQWRDSLAILRTTQWLWQNPFLAAAKCKKKSLLISFVIWWVIPSRREHC